MSSKELLINLIKENELLKNNKIVSFDFKNCEGVALYATYNKGAIIELMTNEQKSYTCSILIDKKVVTMFIVKSCDIRKFIKNIALF